ncbi:MAG: ABC transporter permease [Planctomycetes bacterium]|nr:ABC transporter permease [Planctomycetota bacterium]
MPPIVLLWRNLWRRPLRSILTVMSLAVAVFLICGLRSIITTIRAAADNCDPRRLAVMSASGLFVELPLHYQARIDKVPGVEITTKFQWFGGYYRSQKNFFAQFAIDPETMFAMYPECKVEPDAIQRMATDRTACIIGSSLAREFGWKVGDTIPLVGALHPHPEDKAWEFKVAGLYHSDRPNFDNRTLFFRWDYFEETLKQGGVPPAVGVYSIRVAPGADVAQVIADVEDVFKDSEQRIDCTTEAEFQRQFQSMFGNMPLFLTWIGAGVLIAILVASVNTMLMAMREQTPDIGILKALGFTDGSMFVLFLLQSTFLALLGGGLGVFGALATAPFISAGLEMFAPGYAVQPGTVVLGAVVALAIGPIAGILPAMRARSLTCIAAFRGE